MSFWEEVDAAIRGAVQQTDDAIRGVVAEVDQDLRAVCGVPSEPDEPEKK